MNDTSQEMQWISVEDRLPNAIENLDYSENVLGVCDGQIYVFCRYFEDGHWYWCRASRVYQGLHKAECEFDDDYEVTHWMPLPEPPQSEIVTEALAQINRAHMVEMAERGELPSIIETLVDDE